MKPIFRLLIIPAALSVAAALNAATVKVTSEPADKLTDVRISSSTEEDSLEVVLDQFKDGLERDAKRYLPKDATLEIHFTDIDMAGSFEPWHRSPVDDIRFVRQVYPPRLKFEYKILNADGSTFAEGKEDLVDNAFQMRSARTSIDQTTTYERQMLTDWMRHFRNKQKKG